MSALPAVHTPADLDLPLPAQIEAVLPNLTPNGAQEFVREIVGAISRSKETDDFRPVQDAVTSWYRSLLFMDKFGSTDIADAALAHATDEEPMTFDEVKLKLGI